MSDPNEKSSLASKVVEAMYGEMFSKALKVRDDWPEEIKEKMRKNHEMAQKYHREFILELYEKHMSVEQLQELLRFHTSELGKSIKETQARIYKELNERFKELEKQKEKSGGAYIASRTYRSDDDEEIE